MDTRWRWLLWRHTCPNTVQLALALLCRYKCARSALPRAAKNNILIFYQYPCSHHCKSLETLVAISVRSSGVVYIIIQNIPIFSEPLRYLVCKHKHIIMYMRTNTSKGTVLCKQGPLEKFVRVYRLYLLNETYVYLYVAAILSRPHTNF